MPLLEEDEERNGIREEFGFQKGNGILELPSSMGKRTDEQNEK